MVAPVLFEIRYPIYAASTFGLIPESIYIRVGWLGSTAMLFCAALPTEQVANTALALGAVVTPVITISTLANNEKIINREVVRYCREVKVRFN